MYDFLTGKEHTGVSVTPTKWEKELTDYLGKKFSEIINTGIPTGWPEFTLNSAKQISIRNDETKLVRNIEEATMIQRSQYAIDYFVKISNLDSPKDEKPTDSKDEL